MATTYTPSADGLYCPLCLASLDGCILGILGNLVWFRCQCCGMESSTYCEVR